jgi:hypothetical protein
VAIHRGAFGPYTEEAEEFSAGYGRDEMEMVAERDLATRDRHPAARGWASLPIELVSGGLAPSVAYRLVDVGWLTQGCIAIQSQGLTNSVLTGATFIEITLRSLRQSALVSRRVRVHSWGMAFPWSAGQVQIDVQVGLGPIAIPGPPVVVYAAISRGVPVPEEYPDEDITLGPGPVVINPVDFARDMRLTVLAGGPLVTPVPLAAGQEAVLSARPRTLSGPAGTVVSVVWNVLSP